MRGGTFFKHPKPLAVEHDQELHVNIPVGYRRFGPKSQPTQFQPGAGRPAGGIKPALTFTMPTNTAFAAKTNNDPVDPNAASDGANKAVYVTNEFIALSVDGGATFKSYNPGSLYADFPDGGVCCDQIVQYVPSIGRFVWLDQYWAGANGRNRYRLAVFTPAAVTSAGLTSWTYWDITAAHFPALTRPFLDFPDLAIGSQYLYLSANNGQGGKVYASVIARIGLDNLANGLNLAAGPHAWRYIAGPLFMGRVAQNTGNRAFWAQNLSTSSVGVNYWDESSNVWFGPINIPVFSWPNTSFISNTPDGNNWLAMYTGVILGATRAGQGGRDLYLAWEGGRGSGQLAWLNQPHVELVDIDTQTLMFKSQRVIWNPGFAFGFANLNTSINGDLGVALAWGGNGDWVNFAIGDLTVSPFLVWNTTSSNNACGCGRWGDYLAVRPAGQDRAGFVAAGYGTITNPTGGGGTQYDTHYVRYNVTP
jgi:hypothetical protein